MTEPGKLQSACKVPGTLILLLAGAILTVSQTPPLPTDPVEQFRQLLNLPAEQRDPALAGRPATVRDFLAERVREYLALPPADRELRLRATRLRHYLRPLMALAAAERAPRLAQVPGELRPLVEVRLAQWDRLPEAARREILEHEWMLHAVLRYGQGSAEQQQARLESLPAGRREQVTKELTAWRSLPAEKQGELMRRFNAFFTLDPEERNRVLARLPAARREALMPTILNLQQLPEGQREACLDALLRFVTMTPAQQAQFLQNAAEWRKLSEAEKQAWRHVVVEFPPLPPGLGTPPLPPGLDGTPSPPPIQLLTGR